MKHVIRWYDRSVILIQEYLRRFCCKIVRFFRFRHKREGFENFNLTLNQGHRHKWNIQNLTTFVSKVSNGNYCILDLICPSCHFGCKIFPTWPLVTLNQSQYYMDNSKPYRIFFSALYNFTKCTKYISFQKFIFSQKKMLLLYLYSLTNVTDNLNRHLCGNLSFLIFLSYIFPYLQFV